MDERFKAAVEKVLAHEGGYVNDPDDPGGETNFGISKRTYPHIDIRSLTREKASEIYFLDWWQRYGYSRIDDADLAAKVFDLSVNMGPARAHGLLQEALNSVSGAGLDVDGKLGPKTLAAVNTHPNPTHLLAEFRLCAIAFYLKLRKPKFLAGWVARALS